MIVHGWLEGFEKTNWVNETVEQLLKHRGGCVYFMDYSIYANDWDYFRLVSQFERISAVLTKKFEHIGNFDRQYCFGFSFGARLCVESGFAVGSVIESMDLCDPAGPGFNFFWRIRDPKLGAKNVGCINTSIDKGSRVYNCHQNFRMGRCGEWQPAAGPYPLGSHGLCPYIYNKAFDHEFVPINAYGCASNRPANISTSNVRMGYLGSYNRTFAQGDVFIATAKYPPYLVIDNVIENLVQNTTETY